MQRLAAYFIIFLTAIGCGQSSNAPMPSAPAPAADAATVKSDTAAPEKPIAPANKAEPAPQPQPAATTTASASETKATPEPAAPARPATPEEAAQVLDLSKLPHLKTEIEESRNTIARLSYRAQNKVKPAFEFHKQQLVKAGWKELPSAYVTDETASSTFTKDGYKVSLSVFPTGEEVEISMSNHGNVDLRQLPVPEGAKSLYEQPIGAAYVTEAAVEATAAAMRKLLTAQGWVPYGEAGDSQYYRQNAVQIGVRVFSAPGQGGKTVIDFSSEQLSAELPAPDDAIGLQYSEPPIQLFYDTPKSMQEVHDYYKEVLAPAGWQPTTETPVKQDFRYFVIFRNEAKDLIEATLSEFEGKTRVRVIFQTAAEVEEIDRRAKEAIEQKKKQDAEPKVLPKVSLKLPAGADDVMSAASEVEFTVAPGKAKAAVEALRKQLVDAGFQENEATLEAMFGTVIVAKDDQTITLVYIDSGVLAPEITVRATGVALDVAK